MDTVDGVLSDQRLRVCTVDGAKPGLPLMTGEYATHFPLCAMLYIDNRSFESSCRTLSLRLRELSVQTDTQRESGSRVTWLRPVKLLCSA